MTNLKQFLEESQIAARVSLPAHIIVHQQKLSYMAAKGIIESSVFEPSDGKVCDLEVGGRRIARGRIVRRWGGFFFKVEEMEKGDGQ
jgi:hypothetical protein